MKTWIALGVAVVLGVGVGIGAALVRVQLSPWDGTPGGARSEPAGAAVFDPDAPQPKLVVEEDTHDFGAMDERRRGRYEFVLTNVGDAPLTLRQGEASCKCTSTILEKGDIQPGESAKVVLEWTGKNRTGPCHERMAHGCSEIFRYLLCSSFGRLEGDIARKAFCYDYIDNALPDAIAFDKPPIFEWRI